MEAELPFFQSPQPTLRHLEISYQAQRVDAASGARGWRDLQSVDRREHGRALINQIESITQELDTVTAARLQSALPPEVNLILELETAPGFTFSANDIHSLTTGSEIKLLFARPEATLADQPFTRILLHVPYGNLSALGDKFRRFADGSTQDGNIPNPWVANLQRVARAAFKSLWTDSEPLPDGDSSEWWELWVRRNDLNWAKYQRYSRDLRQKGQPLTLPEHYVVVIQARRSQLEASIELLDTLAEIRRARPCHYELSHLSAQEQHEWIDLALGRIQRPEDRAPAVCLLDTGINRGHILLQPVLAEADNHTIFADGDSSDAYPNHGHGTPMAGLAAYGDLNALVMGSGPWVQKHLLEGVKVFDAAHPHEPDNYGAATQQAVHTPEIVQPHRLRVYSLPITSEGNINGMPSAWSAAIDALAFGSEEPGEPKRLFFISAGNTSPFDESYAYPNDNEHSPIENPAQAWNAVTVGAITHYDAVRETDPESSLLSPIAPAGALSPHSRTSLTWDPHWPIKPEIVMEGGNLARHPEQGIERRDSLDLATTSRLASSNPIVPFRATSAATALAARLAAEIIAEYPGLWLETVRGLIVHSARWNEAMLCGLDPHHSGVTENVKRLLRRYGFGEPNVARARACSQNQVTLFRQDQFTPYGGSAGAATINDCHIHHLRLPNSLLQRLGATTCTLRVTLSYFLAPNPSASNRIPGSRYRYGGSPLRFRVRHKDDSVDNFLSLVSRESNDSDDNDIEAESNNDPAWALGPKLRGKSGSLIQDVWRGAAVDLVTMDRIAVFPVKGWWASRSFPAGSLWHRCHRRQIRYSLIVSIETIADVPLYTEISNLISVPVSAS
ncbi:MAG TPA: S8 family peptidase [Candidatus Limnocylindria bacterium]|nr:S8 family peptidase [Candidatus Limnocylindria bacterium]